MLHSAVKYAVLPAALLLLGMTQATRTPFFPDDITISHAINDCAYVGFASLNHLNYKKNPSSPTIRLVKGGSIAGDVEVYNGSHVNIAGGSVCADLKACDSSTVRMSAGRIGAVLQAKDSSRVEVTGGSIGWHLIADDKSVVIVTGGKVEGRLIASDNSTVRVRGGSIDNGLYAADNSGLTLFSTGLRKTLVDSHVPGRPSDFNVFVVTGKNDGTTLSRYILHGKLSDGTSVNGTSLFIENDSRAKVKFINTRPDRHFR